MPHADNDVVPWVAVEHVGVSKAVRWIQTRSALTRSGRAERNNACWAARTNGHEERIGAGIRERARRGEEGRWESGTEEEGISTRVGAARGLARSQSRWSISTIFESEAVRATPHHTRANHSLPASQCG